MNAQRRGKNRDRRPKPPLDIRVLVVDDDPEIRDILRERLFIEGFQVVTAASGEEALAKFLVHQDTKDAFDVVTLDIRMRDLSGRQVLSLLRKIDQRVCILMISGLDDLSQAVHSLSQGADDYLSKPIKIWDIKDRLITALGRRASLVNRESRKNRRAVAADSGESGEHDSSDRMYEQTVEWGTAIIPSDRFDEDSELVDSDDVDSDDVDSDDGGIESHTDDFFEPASSRRGLAGMGKPASEGSGLTPPNERMGRENGPGNRSDERGTGENRAHDLRSGDRGGDSIEDPKADPRASARGSEPADGGRPGSLPGLPAVQASSRARTPLDAALELARHIENSWEGCQGHGQQVADLLEKIGATLATSLGLTAQGLDGLCLAARLHSLGTYERQEERSREWDPVERTSEAARTLPGRQREDAGLVARILCALVQEEEAKAASQVGTAPSRPPYSPAMSIGHALLGRLDGKQQAASDLDPALRNLLDSHLRDVGEIPDLESETCESSRSTHLLPDEELDNLLALYEVADGWVHLTQDGIGGLSPDEAFPELCAALTNRLPAHPTSMALAYLRARL